MLNLYHPDMKRSHVNASPRGRVDGSVLLAGSDCVVTPQAFVAAGSVDLFDVLVIHWCERRHDTRCQGPQHGLHVLWVRVFGVE